MTPSAGNRRHLSSSPFNARRVVPTVEHFAVDDLVSHDQHGMGRVVGVEGETAMLVDFGSSRVRLTTPFAKVTKL